MKKFIILVSIMFTLTSCAAIRGIGLSAAGKEEIKNILVGETVTTMIEAYCERPADRRQAVAERLLGMGVNLSMISC